MIGFQRQGYGFGDSRLEVVVAGDKRGCGGVGSLDGFWFVDVAWVENRVLS